MRHLFKSTIKFLGVLFAMTITNTIVWEHVAGGLYDCTDGGIPGYWSPGYWVHSWDSRSLVTVPHVLHGRSMSEADTIKEGWSVTGLLGLWFFFFAVSVVISIVLARAHWIPRRRIETDYECVHAA